MMVGPAMPMARMLSTGGALARAISSWRIISSLKVRPRPPYSLGQVNPMKPASYILRCQTRRNSYTSGRGTSEPTRIRSVQSAGRFRESHVRTSSRKDVCSGVNAKSMHPPSRRAVGLDRGTERRFIVIIRAAVEGCQGWARWLVFPRGTLRYTPTRHGGPPRDFTPPLAHAHRGALALR